MKEKKASVGKRIGKRIKGFVSNGSFNIAGRLIAWPFWTMPDNPLEVNVILAALTILPTGLMAAPFALFGQYLQPDKTFAVPKSPRYPRRQK